ncbi:formate-dependent nitrite reductase complex subunit NrfF [bacterium BMS3Abin05]|nr:formate-dependent nitrite reductase complex subunit NrfF [bacterium BMS3Abin05]GBE27745.1 formate-dependent nitrite reductase complex subunit NrfF [bacterium BMS3Bbin03]HDZ11495.1 hypothetical protein [Bacteroidota bacterium]
MKKLYPVMVISLLLIFPLSVIGNISMNEVQKALICQCSCQMALNNCECGTAAQMRSQITGMINRGFTKNQILAVFVKQYGEKVLSAPIKKGFNLTAWILPFLLPIIAGFLLIKGIRRWSKKQKDEDQSDEETLDKKDADQLKKELDQFEEGEDS